MAPPQPFSARRRVCLAAKRSLAAGHGDRLAPTQIDPAPPLRRARVDARASPPPRYPLCRGAGRAPRPPDALFAGAHAVGGVSPPSATGAASGAHASCRVAPLDPLRSPTFEMLAYDHDLHARTEPPRACRAEPVRSPARATEMTVTATVAAHASCPPTAWVLRFHGSGLSRYWAGREAAGHGGIALMWRRFSRYPDQHASGTISRLYLMSNSVALAAPLLRSLVNGTVGSPKPAEWIRDKIAVCCARNMTPGCDPGSYMLIHPRIGYGAISYPILDVACRPSVAWSRTDGPRITARSRTANPPCDPDYAPRTAARRLPSTYAGRMKIAPHVRP